MLVLQRTIDEKIYIGPEIEITVLDVAGRRVKLGISAPFEVEIRRAELGRPPHADTQPWIDDWGAGEPLGNWSSGRAVDSSIYIG